MSRTEEILGTLEDGILRAIFLYVGQGEATLVFFPKAEGGHLSMLVDCNRAVDLQGIDLVRLLADVLPNKNLDYFVNTHPHSDHLGGLKEIRETFTITNVWHSGHKPGKKHDGPYQELKALIDAAKGSVGKMLGSRTPIQVGEAEVQILAPAQYVKDEIEGETDDQRYNRIHEHCAVLRISYGSSVQQGRFLITGDSDKAAWRSYIRYYYDGDHNRVQSDILSASHHGSRTFFKTNADDEDPYTEHLTQISPRYVIISAPSRSESRHDHPHEDALELYKAEVGEEGIYHMGDGGRKWSFVMDIRSDGSFTLKNDRGRLAAMFGIGTEDDGDSGDDGGGSHSRSRVSISYVGHSRPMGK